MDLQGNGITSIHETAFNGLSSVHTIFLGTNLIQRLPVQVLSTLTSLEFFHADSNRLESLDGRLFANNPRIVNLNFNFNQINAMGRNFLDFIPQILEIRFLLNRCANNHWIINFLGVTIETVRQGLSVCFNNFVETPEPEPEPEGELRRFVLELRGPLSLRFENGTEIVRV